MTFPFVSILVAARNEEASIERCLESLLALDYPSDRLEILVGDDASTDRTAALVEAFQKRSPLVNKIAIQPATETNPLKGKTNVLHQLMQKARGDYYLFCDADISVQPDWGKAMLRLFTPTIGVVVGVTRMHRAGLWAAMQSIEWLLVLSFLRFFSFFGIGLTAMGNNMAISRKAYEAVGGYPRIGFSIVEDYVLFKAILAQGFGFAQGFSPRLLSESLPMQRWADWVWQRRRWVQGAKGATWPVQVVFVLTSACVPVLLLLAIGNPYQIAPLLLCHYGFVTLLCTFALLLLRQVDLLRYVLLVWFYLLVSGSWMLYEYIINRPVQWKGRVYPQSTTP